MAINPLLYGIKEVADVLFYPVGSNTPTLFFDTLKVSSLEFTAETTYARGGKGNPKLIGWDYNREIMMTLQDALISQEMMALLSGQALSTGSKTIVKTDKHTIVAADVAAYEFTITAPTVTDVTVTACEKTAALDGAVSDASGDATVSTDTISVGDGSATVLVLGDKYFTTYSYTTAATAETITFASAEYPGTYKIIGDTLIKDEDGTNHAYQFVIHKAKLQPGFNLTMEAEGDPSVFDLVLDVLANGDGDMIELIKY